MQNDFKVFRRETAHLSIDGITQELLVNVLFPPYGGLKKKGEGK